MTRPSVMAETWGRTGRFPISTSSPHENWDPRVCPPLNTYRESSSQIS